jgi:hypothetical protein
MRLWRLGTTPAMQRASPLKSIPQLAEGLGLGVSTPSAFTSGSRHYYATLGKRIFFVGRRAAGALGAIPTGVSVFSFDGSRFEKVSTPAVDKILQGRRVDHISTVSVSGQTAVAFSLGIPTSTTQRALMFFPEWNDWAEWTSIYAQFANDGTRFLGVTHRASNRISRLRTRGRTRRRFRQHHPIRDSQREGQRAQVHADVRVGRNDREKRLYDQHRVFR